MNEVPFVGRFLGAEELEVPGPGARYLFELRFQSDTIKGDDIFGSGGYVEYEMKRPLDWLFNGQSYSQYTEHGPLRGKTQLFVLTSHGGRLYQGPLNLPRGLEPSTHVAIEVIAAGAESKRLRSVCIPIRGLGKRHGAEGLVRIECAYPSSKLAVRVRQILALFGGEPHKPAKS